MFQVQFSWLDAYGRTKRQSITTTAATVALALTEITSFVALQLLVSDAGLTQVSITQKNIDDAYVATAGANVDVAASLQVLGADGFKYDLDIPMIKATKITGGGAVILGDADITNWTDQFLVAGDWRVNNHFPTEITTVLKGQLDK